MTEAAPYQSDDKPGADLPREAPTGQVNDPSYKTGATETVPVVDDDATESVRVEDPMKPGRADSDRQLEQYLGERTRKAKPPGTYAEPSDEQMMGMKK
ncbi:hypothetical protein B0I37DRAFT_419511 [Chaetomium sp. MPI-CAGE-AT-0009]|nr:hypothetical protein B0I37DRAFT_419511 [Chaetomium sp. MPI-CAGE-AT-0009]